MEEKGHILNLSDEILVQICLYLTSEDLVSLSTTCQRFNGVLCERKLVRFVNLEAVYSLTLDSLKKFLIPRLRCQNVQTISLASCYWLNSSELLWAILRLTNLKSLHVNDTNFSIPHLSCVLNTIKSIEKVSWTFHVTKKITAKSVELLSENIQSIKSLNLWVKGSSFFLPLLLSKCFALEELKLSSYKFRSITHDHNFFYREIAINLPSIKTLILNVPNENNCGWNLFITNLIIKITEQNNPWNCLWLDTRGDITRHIVSTDSRTAIFRNCSELYAESLDFQNEEYTTLLLTKPLKYFKFGCLINQNSIDCLLPVSKISHILWRNVLVPSTLPIGLKHLCIECHKKRCDPNLETLISYKVLLHLTCLSVPACLFLSHTSAPSYSYQKETFLKKQSRQSHLKKVVNGDCLLRKFTEYAPNVQELEVKCDENCKTLTQSELASLVLISNWPQLDSLFIRNIPLIDITILITVCTACPKLRRFGLKNIGMTAGISQIQKLVQAINLLKDLEDFQFDHPVIDNVANIVDTLTRLPKIRRVCIIGERTTAPQNISTYLNLLEKCPSLVFLFVRLASISHKMARDFQSKLKTKFLCNRKSLWASIEGIENDDYWENIPTIHCYEMISDPALLTIIPPMKG